jgi:hypothetical protein
LHAESSHDPTFSDQAGDQQRQDERTHEHFEKR